MSGGIGVTPKSTNEFFEMIFIRVLFGSHEKKMFTSWDQKIQKKFEKFRKTYRLGPFSIIFGLRQNDMTVY